MNSLDKTFLPNSNYETRNWFIIDCRGQKLGRLATSIVTLLKGKIKSHYYPSIDVGDNVILINVDSIIIKKSNKYHLVRNPGRPGHSLKIKKALDLLPEFLIEQAIKRMLSKTETKRLIRRLNIYNGEKHPHIAQNPIKLDLTDIFFDNRF